MMQILLIGISAGAAAALLFASLSSGSLIALALAYAIPLPILIAGIGWNYMASLIAAFVAAICVGFLGADGTDSVFSGMAAMGYVITFALPAWWLGYLTLLARPSQHSAQALEWYPPGQIVLWTAVIGVASSLTFLIAFLGPDYESIRANLRKIIEELAKLQGSALDSEKIIDADVFAKILPAVMAWSLTALFIANTWLAAKLVHLSGRLRRPWADLSALHVPKFVPVVFGFALAGMLLPGLPGVIAATVAGAMVMIFTMLGLAVLHVVTRGLQIRPLLLGGVYTVLIGFSWLVWPPLLLMLLGLADAALDLRGRSAATGGPPTVH